MTQAAVRPQENQDLGKVENRKPGRAEGRATGGWPEGRGIGAMQVKDCRKAAPKEEQGGSLVNQTEKKNAFHK
jgi:hypothetical protein